MKLFIKNMVCSRCKMVVSGELEKAGMKADYVELGEIRLEKPASDKQLREFNESISRYGFELIDDRKSRLIEKIKTVVIGHVNSHNGTASQNLSAFLTENIPYEYSYLSNLFSGVEGTTIEKYHISLRIEKVKELLVYDELSLAQIADKLGYSSSAYLSSQFKQVTGLTPTFYKRLKEHKRRNIDDL